MNSTNETFYPLDYWLSLYGFPNIVDAIVAYAITPVWLFSLIFSLFSLFVLLKTPFLASHFFSFMRLYVTNCLVLSALSLTTILVFTRRCFGITNTYEAVFFGVYVYSTAQNSLYLFSSCIEICLVIEKVLYMLPRSFRRIKLISFNNFFLILFIICIAVNIPGIFLYEPAFADIQLDQNAPFRLWYVVPTSFSFSLAGEVLNYFGYIFRDILPMALKIVVNFLSIVLVGKYVRNKRRIRAANSNMVNFDRKQTYVALIMSTFSVLEHILYISSYVLFFFYYYELSNLVYTFALLFIAIKHLLIFFILLAFNNLFRNEVKLFF